MNKRVFIVAGLFYFFSAQAFIYEVSVLRKWLPEQKRYHYFVGLSDYHDRSMPESASQRVQTLDKLNSCNPKETKIILEDLSSRNTGGNFGCNKFFLKSNTGLLASMTQECQKRGFEVENVEYRYCRVIALGPVLHNLKADPRTVASTQKITVQDILDEINREIDGIKKQTYENKSLAALIKKQTDAVSSELKMLKINDHAQKTIGEYLAIRTWPTNRLVFLKRMLTLDSSLLDVKMLNSVLQGQDKKRVIALAGGTHIRRTSDLLQKAGYKLVHQTKTKLFKEANLSKCHVGSDIINGSFCIKPLAVQLDVIDQYLE